MNITEKTLITLEFDKIRQMLASLCPTKGAAERALLLCPDDREEIIEDFTNLLIKYEQDFYSQEFIKNINQMTKDDIEFFEILSSEKLVQLNNTVSILIKSEDKTETREVRFSKSLQNLLEYAFLTNKPIRLDFAKNLTIILQRDTAGMVSAQFISREKAMDTILKNNLPLLKKKLDSSKIKYKKISYKKKQPQGEYHE